MKRILTLALLLALLVAACGTQVPVENVENAASSESAEETDANEEEVFDEEVDLIGMDEVDTSETGGEAPVTELEVVDPAPPAGVTSELSGVTELSPELLALLPAFDEADIQTTETGLRYVILEEGEGDYPAPGDTVQAHYTGYLVNGEKFDSSVDRGVTFDFPLGQRRVIGGWDEGFALLNPGSKALLIIPPVLGYGETGSPPAIPGEATLIFEVELVDVDFARKPIEVAEADYTETESGLKYYDFVVGDGASAQDGEVVSINFALWDSVTGELFGSSDQVGQPLAFPLGREQMFSAMEESIALMKVGGSRQMLIEGELLADSGLPPGNPVIFEIELLGISEGPPADATEVAEDAFTTTEDGTRWADVRVGDGPVLEAGQTAEAQYTLWLTDGQQVDSSLYRQAPEQYAVGASQFPGWNQGLEGVAVGGIRQVIVPADIVGDIGLGEAQDLIFEIEILGLSGQ
ncbi:MAG: FKBP-type peptidyl-prolyl cis-trans isomerase [Candidatus Promineifilaceae bacterium]